jgi:Fe2+ or Zn2+ uptake regulation protein
MTKDILNRYKLRSTDLRNKVLSMLMEGEQFYTTKTECFRKYKGLYPEANTTSIYNTLKDFHKAGMLKTMVKANLDAGFKLMREVFD